MARLDPKAVGKLRRRLPALRAKAADAVDSLRNEFEAGKRGDETVPQPIGPTAREQFSMLLTLVTGRPAAEGTTADDTTADDTTADDTTTAGPSASTEPGAGPENDNAEQVVAAMDGIDWDAVKAATADRASAAAQTMKSMADQVDWQAMKPVAARVSSALIAAVAAGQVPGLGGPLGTPVTRAIINQSGLAQKVADSMGPTKVTSLPDVGGVIGQPVIDATARDA